MRKRGQAAAFIIIGIILLIIVIGFITVKRGVLSDLFEKISGERRLVPQQVKPVQDFLDSCVSQLTLEGTDILAQQGGYIDLPLDPIPTTPFTPLGSNLEIIPNSGFRTSVWFREKGNGIQETNMPSIDDMENSLSDYVAINFVRCVNNLTTFAQQGYIVQASSFAAAKTEITEN